MKSNSAFPMKNLLFLLTSCFILFACGKDDDANRPGSANDKVLVLLSLDGFRHDYLGFTETTALDRIANEGVKADALIPVFPTKTFPNHYTQVTGLYPENHGIVANSMYDSIFNEIFTLSNGATADGKWFEGEPIWVTAEQQGLTTATFFWPGSDAEIKGIRPTYFKPFDSSIPYTTRTQQVLDWLALPDDDRPQFITLYFESPDSEGHAGGPNPTAVSQAIQTVDGQIADLLEGIADLQMEDRVNLIVVSDHGMSQLSRDSMIFLDDYINVDDVVVINYSPVADLIPADGMEAAVFDSLVGAHPKMQVYQKGNIPPELHFNDHRRITPIVCIAEDGWSISTRDFFNNYPNAYQGGAHGYDPKYESMWGIFLAKGPDFKEQVNIAPFESIDLYELMCAVLEIEAAGNDGGRERLPEVLKD